MRPSGRFRGLILSTAGERGDAVSACEEGGAQVPAEIARATRENEMERVFHRSTFRHEPEGGEGCARLRDDRAPTRELRELDREGHELGARVDEPMRSFRAG